MKKTILAIFVIITIFSNLSAQGFDLFESKKTKDVTLYKNLKQHRIHLTFAPFVNEFYSKYVAVGYEYFFTKKWAPFIEITHELDNDVEPLKFLGNDTFNDRTAINLGITYRLTHRVQSWIFFATGGISINNSLHKNNLTSMGYNVNHFFGKMSLAYGFKNGFGLEYGFIFRMGFDSHTWEANDEVHALSLTYEL